MAELTMDALRALANGNLGEAREQMDMEVKLEAAAENAALSCFFTNVGEENWPDNPMEFLKGGLYANSDDGADIGMEIDQEHENWDSASLLKAVEEMKASFLREMHYAAELSSQHKQPNVQQRDENNRPAEPQEDISLREKMEKEAEELAFSQVFCNTYEDTWPEKPFAFMEAASEQGASIGGDLELLYVEDGKNMQPSERYEDIDLSVIADIVIGTKEHILAGMEFAHKLATSDRNAEIEKLRKENEMLRKENKKLSKVKGGR